MALDPRFLAGGGREVFTGNELLVKGCLEVEGGVHLMTGYPGSPVAGPGSAGHLGRLDRRDTQRHAGAAGRA